MKINLNNYLICNKEYLTNINIKYNYKDEQYNHEQYNNYITQHKDVNLIVLPYLYTLSRLNNCEYDYFKTFYFNYLEKSGINIDYPYDDNFIDYIQKNIVLTITFIIAAQYYFL